jgi:medium-chain acyl-[acyl-carrier-protein] hydrolase
MRLFCLPFAGGGASLYRLWPDALGPEIEVCPIQLPGREDRLREPRFLEISELVPALARAVRPYLDRPFACFGHSLGALIAFELARRLRREGGPEPDALLVAARRAPQIPNPRPPIHDLPDARLIEELTRRYDGIPKVVREHPDMMDFYLPIIRADLTLNDTYRHLVEARLTCPISAFGGLADNEVTRDDLAAWGDQTRASFTLRMVPGGHFFHQGAPERLLPALLADLSAG